MSLSAIHSVSSIPASSTRPSEAMPPWGFLALSKRNAAVENIGACNYNDIFAQYPGMDGTSQTIVKVLCENQLTVLDPGAVALSNQGIHGIRDALKKNTNLESLTLNVGCLDGNSDCHETFALDMVSALQVNRGLKSLELDLSPILANQEIFMNLPCFNLASFTFIGRLTPTVAQAVFPKIFSQKFPLANFSWNSYLSSPDDPVASIISSLADGIGKNTCIQNLDLSFNSFNGSTITTLCVGVARSKIQQFFLPQFIDANGGLAPYAFTTEQTAVMLDAARSNPCFLEYVPIKYPLPADLKAGMDNITKGRTPCVADPACDVPVACAAPTPPSPSFFQSLAFVQGAVIGGASGIILSALTALGIYAARTCGKSGEAQPLLQQPIIQA